MCSQLVNTVCVSALDDYDGAVRSAVEIARGGGVMVFPTETVYGLGGMFGCQIVEERMRAVKGRDADKPFQILIADYSDLELLGVQPAPRVKALMDKFWPGPLTAVVQNKDGDWLGLRMPASDFIRDVVRGCSRPLQASSANPAGAVPASGVKKAKEYFDGVVDLVVDGGECCSGKASTVIRITGDGFDVLREEAISFGDIESIFAGGEF